MNNKYQVFLLVVVFLVVGGGVGWQTHAWQTPKMQIIKEEELSLLDSTLVNNISLELSGQVQEVRYEDKIVVVKNPNDQSVVEVDTSNRQGDFVQVATISQMTAKDKEDWQEYVESQQEYNERFFLNTSNMGLLPENLPDPPTPPFSLPDGTTYDGFNNLTIEDQKKRVDSFVNLAGLRPGDEVAIHLYAGKTDYTPGLIEDEDRVREQVGDLEVISISVIRQE